MQHSIKYQYAMDDDGKVLNVCNLEDTSEVRKTSYTCISCNQSVVPVLGKVRQKHFRHIEALECNGETYLHNLSKQLFFQTYKQCLLKNIPFYIELFKPCKCIQCKKDFGITCAIKGKLEKFSLIEYFTDIYLETQCDGFIPDVLLLAKDGEKIFIEFAVTHRSTEEKINLKNRIIELSIIDETSLFPILSRNFSQTNEQIKFYNFNPSEVIIDSNPNCDNDFLFFVLKNNGAAQIKRLKPRILSKKINNGEIVFYKRISLEKSTIDKVYRKEVIDAYKSKKKIMNCFLCRYHALREIRINDSRPIFCKFIKRVFSSTQAISCEYFRPDPEVFAVYLRE